MKKILILMLALSFSTLARADMTVVVPGPAGWWTAVIPEFAKHLGEPITAEIIQGARDIPAGNKWEEKFKFDNNAMWFSNGGQSEYWLIDPTTKYNYKDYEPIFAQNQTIVVSYNGEQDPFTKNVRFAAGSGMNPDAMAITLMVCGPMPSIQAHLDCYKQKFNYVKGMKNAETYLAYARGETNVMRENPFPYKEQISQIPFNKTWFSAGLFDINTGKIIPDPNFPVGTRSFPEAFKAKWGVEPSGELYDAWVLVKNYRDVLQKVIWVNKNNPNKDKLIAAAKKMINDPESQKIIAQKIGVYPWWVGDEVVKAQKALEAQLTEKSLSNLIWWTKEAFQENAVFKPEIVAKIK